ncbi:MAG: hypothetical protein GX605_11525, partial [Chloroflexi bacterium]|nr:hypothetical protein [Chloroflexota bacterium]
MFTHRTISWLSTPLRSAFCCALLLGLLAAGSSAAKADTAGRIAFAANWQGNWDLYHVAADGSDLRRLTADPADDRDPAWSPDGRQVAFRSQRDGNWELYRLDLASGELVRLTRHPAFDGQPTWSPDGQWIAFSSTREGDLDVFVVSAQGGEPRNLTAHVPAGDFAPAWSPDGQWIAFTSWRAGDNDLYVMDAQGEQVRQLTDGVWGDEYPVWSPDGQHLAYIQRETRRSSVYRLALADPPAEGGAAQRLTWLSSESAAAWSPDGEAVAAVQLLSNHEALWVQRLAAGGASPCLLEDRFGLLSGPLSWSAAAGPWGEPASLAGQWALLPGMEAQTAAEGERAGFYRVPNLEVPNERLNALIAHSFVALRQRVREETGWDFLGQLSDAWRPLEAEDDTSSFGSWHKAGRAVDLLFDLR